jgi:hypothetical protein
MGGLQIQHPEETVQGLRINLILKYFHKSEQGNITTFISILENMFHQSGHPSLQDHVNTMGPGKWLKIMQDSKPPTSWSPKPSHQSLKLFPFYPAGIATLKVHRVNTVSQLFDTQMSGGIDKVVSPILMTNLQAFPNLCHKIKLFIQSFLQKPFRNNYASLRTNLTNIDES